MSSARTDIRTCPLADVDTFDADFLQDPHPFYRRLRDEAPVFRDPKNNIVYVSTHERVMEALAKPRIFSNQFGAALRSGGGAEISPEEAAILAETGGHVDTMLTADPPSHTRYKRLSGRAFTYKKVLGMNAWVEGIVHELIDGFIADGQCEFKEAFANPLPMYVICDSLGFPRERRAEFKDWTESATLQLSGMATPEQRIWCAEMLRDTHNYFLEVCAERRANPGTDIISDLVQEEFEDEDGTKRPLTDDEMSSILRQIFVAGNETTAHTLTTGMYYLLTHPEQMEELRSNPALAENFVEESLRMLTPTNNMWRVATEDTEIGGVAVNQGDLLLLRFGSANRDEAKFPDGDTFDLHRDNAKEHLSFGGGVHLCLGQQLARKEMQTAFPIVLDRLKNVRFADPDEEFRYVPSILLRGVEKLNLTWDP